MTGERKVLTPGRMVYAGFWIALFPFLLLWLGGDWRWTEARFFGIFYLIYCIYAIAYLNRHSPELLEERFRRIGTGGQKRWDKYFDSAIVIVFLAWFIVMPLDAKRYHWSPPFPLWIEALGFLLLLPSFYFMFRAYADNPFASPLVRIQEERKQHVVSTGVYAVVRHPLYLGALLWIYGLSLTLGSLVGLLFGVITTILVAARIIGEEKMLAKELEGYEDYRKKVKWRLMPYLW